MSCDAVELGMKIEDMKTFDEKKESRFSVLKGKLGYVAAGAALGGSALVSSASATDIAINWTSITDLIDGVTTIFPSLGNMVVGIVPVIFVLIIVVFVVRFFDSIIGMIEGVIRIFR